MEPLESAQDLEFVGLGELSTRETEKSIRLLVREMMLDKHFPIPPTVQRLVAPQYKFLWYCFNLGDYFRYRLPFLQGGSGLSTIPKQLSVYETIYPSIKLHDWMEISDRGPETLQLYTKISDCKLTTVLLAYALELLKEKHGYAYDVFFKQILRGPHIGILLSQKDKANLSDAISIDFRAPETGETVPRRQIHPVSDEGDRTLDYLERGELHLSQVNFQALRKFDLDFIAHKNSARGGAQKRD